MTDVGLGSAQPRRRAGASRVQSEPVDEPVKATRHATGDEPDVSGIAEPIHVADTLPPKPPANPYAPTGWQTKSRVEFDLTLPSGQLCRLMRLEREDLFRLNLMEYLDTFTPMLMGDMNDEERSLKMKEAMTENPEALMKMLQAIDKIVMAATIKPRVTDDEELVDIGTEKDWSNPNFVATIPVENIPMMERMYIFGAAFGRSMDDLKSLWDQAEGMGSLADVPSVQQST